MSLTRPELLERIDTALLRGGDHLRYADLVALARVGKAQFWANETAAVATEVLKYPQRSIMNCFMAAGELRGLFRMQDVITDFAREHHCSHMICHGRVAWGAVGARHGWHPRAMLFVREVPR